MSFGNCKGVPRVASRNIGTKRCMKFLRMRHRPTQELLQTRMYIPSWEIQIRDRNNLTRGPRQNQEGDSAPPNRAR